MKKTDKRVQHTKAAVRAALLDVMETKPVDKISVKELCERADINRNTFYTHYDSPSAVLREMEEDYFQKNLRLYQQSVVSGDIRALLLGMMHTAQENPKFSAILYAGGSGATVLEQMKRVIGAHFMTVLLEDNQTDSMETARQAFQFVFGGMAETVRIWVQNGMREDPERLAGFLADLCDTCFARAFGKGAQDG